MAFRERMAPKTSNIERWLQIRLGELGLTEGLITQCKINLSAVAPAKYTANKCNFETIPDFAWPRRKKAVYLDGDRIHVGKRLDVDEDIIVCLKKLGWDVLRVRYHAPPSGKRKREIEAEVVAWLGA